jgi:hypothetical protein
MWKTILARNKLAVLLSTILFCRHRRYCQIGIGNAFIPNTMIPNNIRRHSQQQHFFFGTVFQCGTSNITRHELKKVVSSSRYLTHRSSSSSIDSISNVAIIGGGLAGLSTAYHLLEIAGSNKNKYPRGIQITIFDKALVGEGGASSVAGG